ncbi:Rad52/Rad22 family DNA repair protein [Pelatocladus sp. BLCC-F211]|uniref:Rad52/Rad22 family DNA repair protein n=1 Tax=Pelatocladus sp. BLCC-F211 TaxID=3342752 RepID=UPI0035BB136F
MSNIRDELKKIQAELRKPLGAIKHKVRDIPGSNKKWVYLPHQVIREHLDTIVPEWVIDFSDIQYIGNDATCRCAITIMGIRKEAIACVPISLTSGSGKEMTRGSAPDRLAAEGIRNAAEQWGVGRYLDDQEFTIRYLWERIGELDQEMQGEVRRLAEQYKIDKGIRQPRPKSKDEGGMLQAMSGVPVAKTISEGQVKRLWAIAKSELKLDDEVVKSIYKKFGFEKTEQITTDKYEAIIEQLRQVPVTRQSQDLYPANNNIIKSIRNVTKHQPDWIYAQCRHYGFDRPGMMPPDELPKLISDMCADFAVVNKVIGVGEASRRESRFLAHTSIQGAISFAKASGGDILPVVIDWLERHQAKAS